MRKGGGDEDDKKQEIIIMPTQWARRIFTAVTCIPLAVYCLSNKYLAFALIYSLLLTCVYEFNYHIRPNIKTPNATIKSKTIIHNDLFAIATIVALCSCANPLYALCSILLSVFYFILKLLLLLQDLPKKDDQYHVIVSHNLTNFALDIYAFVFIICGFSSIIMLRQAFNDGFELTIVLVVGVWQTDNGALFCGKLFGQEKLMPSISPGKTRAGAVGGVLLSTVSSVVAFNAIKYNKEDVLHSYDSLWHQATLGFIISIFAIFGDLFESYLKRIAGVKDSGNLFPGHGGCLDRMDSFLLASHVILLASLKTYS